MENKNKKNIMQLKDSISKQEYSSQVNIVTENTINLIIEKGSIDEGIDEIKKLMDLDLNYKEKSSEIRNKSILENPIFQIDDKNEKNKRIINYLLSLTAIICIAFIVYVSNPIATFFLGTISVISVIALSFNTRATIADKRMMSGLMGKFIEKLDTNNSSKSNNNRRRK
jgi:hypothetical protein